MTAMQLLTLVFLCHVTSTLQYGMQKKTHYEARDLKPGGTVTVESFIKGVIEWRSSDDQTLRIDVVVNSEDARALKNVNVSFLSDSHAARLRIAPAQSLETTSLQPPQHLLNAASLAKLAVWIYLMMAAVWIPIVGQGWQHGLVGPLLFLSIFCLVSSKEPQDIRVEITISSPRNLRYRDVELFVLDGNITVDSDVLNGQTTVSCTTTLSDKEGCPSCCHGHGTCGESNQCICKDQDNDEIACAQKAQSVHALFTNPGDSRITQTTLPSGDVLDVYGKRRRDGSIRAFNTIKVGETSGRNLSVAIDNKARIQSIRSSDGSSMSFNWKSKCDVYVTATTADKRRQVNVDIKLCRQQQRRSLDTKENARGNSRNVFTKNSKRGHRHVQISGMSGSDVKGTMRKNPYAHVPVIVTQCGIPFPEADVYGKANLMIPNRTSLPVEYVAVQSDRKGYFSIKIPNKPAPKESSYLSKVCSTFSLTMTRFCSKVLSKYFKYRNKVCTATEKAFILGKGESSTGISDILNTCSSGFNHLISYCKDFNSSLLRDENSTSCDGRFDSIIDIFSKEPIFLTPVANFVGGRIVQGAGRTVTVDENTSSLSRRFVVSDDRPNIQITGFSVSPNDPQPQEMYEVRMDYVCAMSTTEVHMKIEGSDKYTNRQTCSGVTDCKCCILYVAGASELVVDTVTISVTDVLSGYNFTREIIVVF